MKKQHVFWSLAVLAALAVGTTGCGGSSSGCPGDLSKCDGECVDTSTDRSNCGACGTTCPNGQLCVSGTCTPCNDQCSQGEKECVDDSSFRLCQMDGNTCWVWGPAQQCAAGLVCDGDGECVEGCVDQCTTEGETVCTQDGTGTRMCGQYDADECLDLSSPIPCGAGYACEDGTCVETCSDECTTEGDRQCSGDGYDVCGDYDADSCLEWGGHVVCPDGTSCSSGQCSSTCTDECEEGRKLCDGNGYRTCGQYDSDPCLDWSSITPCASYETCQDGECVVSCSDECDLGEQRCAGDGYDQCNNYDADPCLEWGGHVACPLGFVCDPDTNTCVEDCVDECEDGARICDGDGYRVCGDHDSDSCLEWSDVNDCGAGETCSNGVCSPTCSDECAQGDRACEGNAYKVCGNYDSDPCLDWSSPTSCLSYESCEDGYCVVSCLDECQAQDERRCSGDGYDVCGDYDADPCLEWGGHVACPAGYRCESGQCIEDCVDACTDGERICDGEQNGYRICGDYDTDSCLEFSSVFPCEQDETCSDGACSPNCSDECADGNKECYGSGWRQCGDYDSDPCLDWSSVTSCLSYEVCDPATVTCVPNCTDACTTEGEQQCSGNGYVVCGNYDADPCLDWSGVNPCQAGYICDPETSTCVEDCSDECDPEGSTQCSGDGYDQCGDYDTDSCLEWGGHTVCPANTTCSNGVCEEVCSDECDTDGQTICEGLMGLRTCGDYDEDDCLDLSGVTYCADNEECQDGACVQVCTDECVTGERRCDGSQAQICGEFDGDPCLDWGTVMDCTGGTMCYRGQCIDDTPTATVWINEVLYDDDSYDGEYVYIELWGPAGLSLDNFSVVGINGNGGGVYERLDLDGYVLPDDGFFVIAHEDTLLTEFDLQADIADLQNGPDNVQVTWGGAVVVDALGYGSFGSEDIFAGEGNPAPDARYDTTYDVTYCLSRLADHTDTDDNSQDFLLRTYCTPGWAGYGEQLASLGVASSVNASPAVDTAGGVIYVPSQSYIDAVETDLSGWRWWITEAGEKSSPALSGDATALYVGLGSGAATPGLHAYDTTSGTELWVAASGTEVLSSPAVGADGSVYFGTRGGGVVAVHADGSAKWTHPTANWVDSSPALANLGPAGEEYVVVGVGGVGAGEIIALDAASGALAWSVATGGGCNGSPAVAADGTVYIGCDDGMLYAIDGATGTARSGFPVTIVDGGGDPLVAGRSPVVMPAGTTDWIFCTSRGDSQNFYIYDAQGNNITGGLFGDAASSVTLTSDYGFMLVSQGTLWAYGPVFTLEWYASLGGYDAADWIVSSPTAVPDGSGGGTGIVYAVAQDTGRVYAFQGAAELLQDAGAYPKFRGDVPNSGHGF